MTFKLNGQKYRITFNVALLATVSKDGAAELNERICGSDAAVCHTTDLFNPRVGAKLAVTRVLQRVFRNPEDREVIWSQIRDKVGEKGKTVFADAANEARFWD